MNEHVMEICLKELERIKQGPSTDIKEVMKWLIDDKEVFYRPIHPGIPDSEAGDWLPIDPSAPALGDEYEYTYKNEKPRKVTIEFEVPFKHQVSASYIRSLLQNDDFLLEHMKIEG